VKHNKTVDFNTDLVARLFARQKSNKYNYMEPYPTKIMEILRIGTDSVDATRKPSLILVISGSGVSQWTLLRFGDPFGYIPDIMETLGPFSSTIFTKDGGLVPLALQEVTITYVMSRFRSLLAPFIVSAIERNY